MIKPIGPRVVLKVDEGETQTSSGLVLTTPEKKFEAEVIATGLLCKDVEVGDRVLFPQHVGIPIAVEGSDYLMMAEEDLIGIFTD